ncbi:MAG TPA: AsmA-like C-terminal region-containing protein [Bryobacteraceae bacterium]|nr:AsmA-like C-terminal region-containing protein [Bryobacteraceae bacterium]
MRVKGWLIAAAVVIAAALVFGNRALSALVRDRLRHKLDEQYGKGFQTGRLNVTLLPHVAVTAENVVYRPDPGLPPLITIRKFTAETNWLVVLGERVSNVRLEGLVIVVPPRKDGAGEKPVPPKTSHLVIDRLVTDGAVLRVLPKKPGKQPLEFDLQQLTITGVGESKAMHFQTILKNVRPPGEIHSTGTIGPWQADPALTPVSGDYTFDHADLSVFKGIAGMLSSRGSYKGVLDRIEVAGATDTPDFSLRVSGQPMHLTTQFHAVVDGMNGNTLLDAVNGRLGDTPIETHGSVDQQPGEQGKTVRLDARVRNGKLADMLRLAVPGQPTMNGLVSFTCTIVIPPGAVDIVDKLQLAGRFTIARAEFSKLNVQEKVNELSHRGSGNPKEPPDENVASNFHGTFKLSTGTIAFSNLSFQVPGVSVALAGTYGLDTRKIDLHGRARLQAKLSQTVTGVKSFLLKALNPLFSTNQAGAVIPLHIGGTAQSPSFGLGSKSTG